MFSDTTAGSISSSASNSSPPRIEVPDSGIGADRSGATSSTTTLRMTSSILEPGYGSTCASTLGSEAVVVVCSKTSSTTVTSLDSSRLNGHHFGNYPFFSLRPYQQQVSEIRLWQLLYTTSTQVSRIHTFNNGGFFKHRLSPGFGLPRPCGFSCLCRVVFTISRSTHLGLIPRQVSGFPAPNSTMSST
jgi:hypothetical protein